MDADNLVLVLIYGNGWWLLRIVELHNMISKYFKGFNSATSALKGLNIRYFLDQWQKYYNRFFNLK